MSKVVDYEQTFTEEVNAAENVEEVKKEESEEKVEQARVVETKEDETKEEENKESLSFLEKILHFLTKYLGCSNKRADVIISANKPVEMETNKNDEEVASAAI